MIDRKERERKAVYPVIFTEDEKGEYLVEVPDMGILTEGKDLAEAMFMARDAIGLKGIVTEDENKEIPEPSRIEDIKVEEGTFTDAGKSLVALDVDFTEYRRKNDNKTVRRNVTLPSWLDRAAAEAGFNVSQVLREALAEKLHVNL